MGLLSQAPMADCAFVCTLDDDHTAPALKAMELGYHLLPEKPMSNTEEEGCSIVQMANQTGRTLAFCHVLHDTPFYVTIKRLIDYGEIGEVTTINKSGSSALFWGEKRSPFLRIWVEKSAATAEILVLWGNFCILRESGECRTSVNVSLQRYLICFAAERSRKENTVIERNNILCFMEIY